MASSNLHCVVSGPNLTWHGGSTKQLLSKLYCSLSSCLCVDTSHLQQLGRVESGEYSLMSLYPIINVTGCWAAPWPQWGSWHANIFPGTRSTQRQHHLTRTSHTMLLQQIRFSYCLHVVGDLRKAAMLSAGVQSLKVKPVEAAVQ